MKLFSIRSNKIATWLSFVLLLTAQSFPAYSQSHVLTAQPANEAPEVPAEDAAADDQASTTDDSAVKPDPAEDDNPLSPATPEDSNADSPAKDAETETETGAEQIVQTANTVNAAAVNATTFPGQPVVTTFSNQANVTINQASSSEFRMNYDISAEGAFGGAIINFGASPAGAQNLSAFTQYQFELATNNACPAGTPCLKIEFVDTADQIAAANIDALSADFAQKTITQDQLRQANPAINFSSIKQINFVVDQALTSQDVGFYDVRAGGLAFTPTVTGQSPAGTPTALPGTPAVTTFSNQSTVSVEQAAGSNQFRTNYDLSAAGSFGGSIINYGDGGTPANLSGIQQFVFNMATNNACASSKCHKIEFVDAAGQIATVNVTGLDSTLKAVTIPQSLLDEANANLDLTQIRQINFVFEEANTNPKAGFLDVQTGGFGATPNPNPDPNPNPNPDPNPNPNPDPNPDPDPTPDPGPGDGGTDTPSQPGDAVFTGITEGQTVTGTVTVQPDLTQTPDIRKVAYYLNGTKAGRSYDQPFIWGGASGIDTTQLANGQYTLLAVYTTPQGDQNFTVSFNVNNPNAPPPSDQPQAGQAAAFTGITPNQDVSGTITVQPDLQQLPNIHKVFYYVDGKLAEKEYAAPFALTLDTSTLGPGPHTLTIHYGTTDADFLNPGEFLVEIPFTTGGTGTSTSTSTGTDTNTNTAANITVADQNVENTSSGTSSDDTAAAQQGTTSNAAADSNAGSTTGTTAGAEGAQQTTPTATDTDDSETGAANDETVGGDANTGAVSPQAV